MASLLSRGGRSTGEQMGLLAFKYNAGILLVEPINGDPYVINLRHGERSKYLFESKPRSGTDKLRQRIFASMWFDSLEKQNSTPYYLLLEDVPTSMKLEDLPIMVGAYKVFQNSKPFKDKKNPISGHEWREPTGLARNCSIDGPGARLKDTYGTVNAAFEHIEFLEKYPFHPEPTEREISYIENSDAMLTRALRSRPSA